MRFYRPLLTLLIAAAAFALSAQPAAALPSPDPTDYPAQSPSAGVSDGTVSAGSSVTFTGSGFQPGEVITITVTLANGTKKVIGTVTANSIGEFSASVPLTDVGTATLTAEGESGVVVSSTVTVTADTSDGGGTGNAGNGTGDGLAVTGNDGRQLALQVAGAVAAIAIGSALVWFAASRRRRADESA